MFSFLLFWSVHLKNIANNSAFYLLFFIEILDGFVLKIYLNHKFQWPQEGLNFENLAYEVVTYLTTFFTFWYAHVRFSYLNAFWSDPTIIISVLLHLVWTIFFWSGKKFLKEDFQKTQHLHIFLKFLK